MKNLDVAAIGTCYIDINATDFPFDDSGIPAGTETLGQDYELVAGGSAVNFCRMLGSMGLETAFVGMTGEDAMGKLLVASLESERVKSFVARNVGMQTNISFNMTSQAGEHIMGVAGTANASLAFNAIDTELEQAIADAKFLYVGGCFKLKSLSPDFERLSSLTNEHNTALAVDHGRTPVGVVPDMLEKVKALVLAADYYFPSKEEFCTVWSVDTIEDGIRGLASQAPRLHVIVKDGSNGAYYFDNGDVQHVPANKVKDVKDVTGAGDAFNAGVIKAVINRRDIRESVQYGCDVAAAKIGKLPIPSLDNR